MDNIEEQEDAINSWWRSGKCVSVDSLCDGKIDCPTDSFSDGIDEDENLCNNPLKKFIRPNFFEY